MRAPKLNPPIQPQSRREALTIIGGTAAALITPAASRASPSRPRMLVPLDRIEPGQQVEVEWARLPIFIRRRTVSEIGAARSVALDALRDPQRDEDRTRDPQWLVVIGECTHAGCQPLERLGAYGGWLCLCHGSHFDTSGRVRRGPAPTNLKIPPYRFLSPKLIEIGVSGTLHPTS